MVKHIIKGTIYILGGLKSNKQVKGETETS